MKLSASWVIFYHEIEALFGEDPGISTQFDEDSMTIRMYVQDPEKAEALTQLLPAEKKFGNVSVKIQVIPANMEAVNRLKLFGKALEGNPVLSCIKRLSMFPAGSVSYIVFKKKIAQFPADDTTDIDGKKSMLYEDIAADVFDDVPGIFYCTDKED